MSIQKNPPLFLVYLMGLSIIGFLATDMYLPAFEQMRQDFGSTKTYISASLSIFLGGYAIAQLLWGEIADRYGKPKAILIGLSVFAFSSLAIYFTHSIAVLLILRLVQAIGVCAAAVSWQALVIERFPAEQTNKVLATIMPLVALSPALAPLAGAYLLEYFGWRSIFITLAILAVLLMLYTFTLSTKASKPIEKAGLKSISYLKLFQNKAFIGNVMIYAFCSGAFFAWLTGSPFFLKELGYNEKEIGLSFIPQTIAFIVGGYGYRTLIQRVKTATFLPKLLLLYAVSIVSLLLITLFIKPTLRILLVPFCLMALANGAAYPIVVARALKPFAAQAGKASALQNTIQLGVCFLTSALVSIFATTPLLTTMIVMTFTLPFVYLGYRMAQRQD